MPPLTLYNQKQKDTAMARISKIQQEMNDKFIQGAVDESREEQLDAYEIKVSELQKQIDILIERVNAIQAEKVVQRKSSINRVEAFNNEVETTPDENRGIRMTESDKIISMQNAAKILPPNMIENGRHLKENIQAICGFIVDDDMMDAAYTGFKHEE